MLDGPMAEAARVSLGVAHRCATARETNSMANVTLDDVIELAEQLPERDRAALLTHLQIKLAASEEDVTRESLLAEHARLKAGGAFDRVESLADRYARPELQLEHEEI